MWVGTGLCRDFVRGSELLMEKGHFDEHLRVGGCGGVLLLLLPPTEEYALGTWYAD